MRWILLAALAVTTLPVAGQENPRKWLALSADRVEGSVVVELDVHGEATVLPGPWGRVEGFRCRVESGVEAGSGDRVTSDTVLVLRAEVGETAVVVFPRPASIWPSGMLAPRNQVEASVSLDSGRRRHADLGGPAAAEAARGWAAEREGSVRGALDHWEKVFLMSPDQRARDLALAETARLLGRLNQVRSEGTGRVVTGRWVESLWDGDPPHEAWMWRAAAVLDLSYAFLDTLLPADTTVTPPRPRIPVGVRLKSPASGAEPPLHPWSVRELVRQRLRDHAVAGGGRWQEGLVLAVTVRVMRWIGEQLWVDGFALEYEARLPRILELPAALAALENPVDQAVAFEFLLGDEVTPDLFPWIPLRSELELLDERNGWRHVVAHVLACAGPAVVRRANAVGLLVTEEDLACVAAERELFDLLRRADQEVGSAVLVGELADALGRRGHRLHGELDRRLAALRGNPTWTSPPDPLEDASGVGGLRVATWAVSGPSPAPDGLSSRSPAEADLFGAVSRRLASAYGRERLELTASPLTAPLAGFREVVCPSGELDLRAALGSDGARSQLAYCAVDLDVGEAGTVDLRLVHDDGVIVLLDGREILRRDAVSDGVEAWLPLRLAVGRHRLVLKVYNIIGPWVVAARLTGADGRAPGSVHLKTPELRSSAGGPVLWSIGDPDGDFQEFDLRPSTQEWLEHCGEGVEFLVGITPARDWPSIQAGPKDRWGGWRSHRFRIRFAAPDLDAKRYALVIDTVSQNGHHPPTLRVSVNGYARRFELPGGSDTALRETRAGRPVRIVVPVDRLQLGAGDTCVDLEILEGSWVIYDAIRFEVLP